MTPPLVLLVGHCMPDSFSLKRTVRKAAPDAVVRRVNSTSAMEKDLPDASLLLVNRVLDGRFDHDSGISLIEALAGESPPAMLISNFAEAQDQAQAAGALPGFGKSELRTLALDRIRAALNIHAQ